MVPFVAQRRTERAGFEPAVQCYPYTRFPSVLDQPLRHLSNSKEVVWLGLGSGLSSAVKVVGVFPA
jgi:hypothetical protein